MQRYLDLIEEPAVHVPDGIHIMEYRGDVDIDLLQCAFNYLCERHPVLQSYIRSTNNRYILEADNVPPRVAWRAGSLDDVLPKDHGHPFAKSETNGIIRRIANLIVIKARELNYIALNVHHVVTSGGVGPQLFLELWDLYTALVNGTEVSVTRGQLPRSPTEILEHRWPRNPTPYGQNLVIRNINGEPASYERIRLGVNETKRVIECAKLNRVAINSFILKELVETVKKYAFAEEARELTVACRVDLRKRVNPPINITDTTLLFGDFIATIPNDVRGFDIARSFRSQLDAAISNRDLMIRGWNVECHTPGLLGTADISWNASGNFPSPRTPSSVRVTDYFEGHYKFGEINPILLPTSPIVQCLCYTFQSELNVWLLAVRSRSDLVEYFKERIQNVHA